MADELGGHGSVAAVEDRLEAEANAEEGGGTSAGSGGESALLLSDAGDDDGIRTAEPGSASHRGQRGDGDEHRRRLQRARQRSTLDYRRQLTGRAREWDSATAGLVLVLVKVLY